MSRELAAVPRVLGAQPGGDEEIDGLADQLILGIAKHPLRLAVGAHDLSERPHHDDTEGADLDQTRQYRFGSARIACKDWRETDHSHVRTPLSAERSTTRR